MFTLDISLESVELNIFLKLFVCSQVSVESQKNIESDYVIYICYMAA